MGPTSGILKIRKRRELRAGEDMDTGHYAVYSMLLVGVSALCCTQGRNYRPLLVSGVPLADGITEPCVCQQTCRKL